mmetsp:Transcript_12295/g.49322  ORF Transcript_12295/g.49322 Transcript_12295/m.49322 type:complete len:230 (+) Transcript_12295:414-1103(+)
MKPGLSTDCAVVLPIAWAAASVVASVAGEVARLGITSTSFMTGTGFMKCMPTTRSGAAVAAPMRVMLIDDVLLASTACGAATSDRRRKRSSFRPSFSVAASTTRSASARSSMRVDVRTRPSVASTSAASSLPFATAFSSSLRMNVMPLSSCSCWTSTNVTSIFATCAATCAIPLPIWPAPSTPTFLTSAGAGASVLLARQEHAAAAATRLLGRAAILFVARTRANIAVP